MVYESCLKHYGVVGMKWGIRRGRNKGVPYHYKSSITKLYEEKSDKYAKKSEKYKDKKEFKSKDYKKLSDQFKKRANRSYDLDQKMQSIARQMTTGETVTSLLLKGGLGTKTILMGRALGESYERAAGKELVTRILGGFGGRDILNAMRRVDYSKGKVKK